MHSGARNFSLGLCALLALGAGALAQPAAGPEMDGAFLEVGPPLPTAADTPAIETDAAAATADPVVRDPVAQASPAPSDDPAAQAATTESRPLGAPPQKPAGEPGASASPFADTFAGNWVGRTILALALVIGLAILMRAVVRRASLGAGGLSGQLGAGGKAPSGLLSVLGRYPIARGQTLVLLKVDRRVLLLCQTGAGFTTLSEITQPEEVASILVNARDEEGSSMAARFSNVLQDLERDPRIAGVESDGGAYGPTTPRGRALRVAPAEESGDPVAQLRRRLASLSESAG
jgi:flagellar biogenesis protein FliO